MNAPASRISTAPASPWLAVHPALGISLMDHLFNRLDGAYPNRWRAAFATDQAIANWRESWAEAFDEEGITREEIKAGLRACRKMYDWPPSIAEFIKACRPPIDPTVAYYEALYGVQARRDGKMGTWSSRAIYWAAQRVGPFDLLNQSYSVMQSRWEKALADELAKPSHAEIPEPNLALPEPGKAFSTNEEAARQLAQLGATAVYKRGDAAGSKDWAHRVLARDDVPYIAKKFAREALGVEE